MAKKKLIVRVEFSGGTTMLFGDSYKPWDMQVDEYIWFLKNENKLTEIEDVSVSNSPWISWGGLKWCPEKNFQEQLNREGCQSDEPDNKKPRKYSDMIFYQDQKITAKLTKMVENYLANIY